MALVHYVEGSVVDGFCPKCEAITEHTIVKVTKRSIREVKCEACAFVHKYQKTAKAAGEEPSTRKKGRRKAVDVDEKAQARADWEASCAEHAAIEPLEYGMSASWMPDQVLLHPTFGKGIVLKKLSDKKVEVMFESGRKRLVQNLGK